MAVGRRGAGRQIELAAQPLGTEGRQLAAQLEDLLLAFSVDLVGTVMGGAGKFLESVQALGLVAPQPLAHRGQGGLEDSRRSFDAALASGLD